MTIKQLKDVIKDLPDSMEVVMCDYDGHHSFSESGKVSTIRIDEEDGKSEPFEAFVIAEQLI